MALFGYFVDFLCFYLFIQFGLGVFVANLNAFLVGAFINLLLIRRYVFLSSRFSLCHDYVATIAVNGGFIVIGSFALVWIVEAFPVDVYLAKFFISGVTFACNYLVRKVFFNTSA
ncbi:GtrA family protein [Neptuniibacter sp. SY11_33]|uniref:GtrA family protein n=1 Tax=Neptuniibacter sp. SY11_33 TaxID=3398215 RepID=UPI0039F55FAC